MGIHIDDPYARQAIYTNASDAVNAKEDAGPDEERCNRAVFRCLTFLCEKSKYSLTVTITCLRREELFMKFLNHVFISHPLDDSSITHVRAYMHALSPLQFVASLIRYYFVVSYEIERERERERVKERERERERAKK